MAHSLAPLRPVFREILDAVFPPRCAGCGNWNKTLFCPKCQNQLIRIEPPFCLSCGAPFDPEAKSADECADCRKNRYHNAPPFHVARSALAFDGPIRSAIHRFKYREKIAHTAPLAEFLAELLERDATLRTWKADFLAPVPLHRLRKWRRGYNQSELLARELSQLVPIPTALILKRIRPTPPQVRLNAERRKIDVKDAFAIDPKTRVAIAGANILLVDDVYTTGATLRECAKTLKNAGAGEIGAITLARHL